MRGQPSVILLRALRRRDGRGGWIAYNDGSRRESRLVTLSRLLSQRAAENKPLRIALIGAGTFGSMLLAQVRRELEAVFAAERGIRRDVSSPWRTVTGVSGSFRAARIRSPADRPLPVRAGARRRVPCYHIVTRYRK